MSYSYLLTLYATSYKLAGAGELFIDKDVLGDFSSVDTTLMERVSLIDGLTKEEQSTIFSILDAFVAKRKLKSTLKTVLQDMD